MQTPLNRQATSGNHEGADTGALTSSGVGIWTHMDTTLSPVIGKHGVAAVYQRSLHLTRKDYPWLTDVHAASFGSEGFAPLHTALSRQTGAIAIAIAANGALVRTFRAILARLIGPSLAARLLPPLADESPADHPPQPAPPEHPPAPLPAPPFHPLARPRALPRASGGATAR